MDGPLLKIISHIQMTVFIGLDIIAPFSQIQSKKSYGTPIHLCGLPSVLLPNLPTISRHWPILWMDANGRGSMPPYSNKETYMIFYGMRMGINVTRLDNMDHLLIISILPMDLPGHQSSRSGKVMPI